MAIVKHDNRDRNNILGNLSNRNCNMRRITLGSSNKTQGKKNDK